MRLTLSDCIGAEEGTGVLGWMRGVLDPGAVGVDADDERDSWK